MNVLPPVAAAQAGHAQGGGFLDSLKSMASGGAAPAAPAQAPAGDGSVGLFDGVGKKMLFSGALGAGVGFLPFIPGGPILGGIMGALGGAAMGMFGNWRKMQDIKAQNQATIAALGVQAQDPQVQQILQSGNVSQLLPYIQQGAAAQTGVGQAGVGQSGSAQQVAPQGPNIQQVYNPSTGVTQLIDLSTGQVVQQGAGVDQGLPPVVNPATAANPGVAPALAAAGGGSAGDVGRPAAPVGTNSSDVSAIAPTQAGIGGVEQTNAQLNALIEQLQRQIDDLKAYIAERERQDALDVAAAR